MDKPKKDKIKEKAAAVKAKAKAAKGKMKGAKCVALLFALAALVTGCMTPEQASRSTHSTYGDIEPDVRVEAVGSNYVNVAVNITFGDGAIASADSSGSTESQTQTPTFDISPKTDLRYNDAMAAASNASRGVLESLTTAGANKVLSLMSDKSTGTVEVQKADGSTATVSCKDGQCSFVSGTCTDAACSAGNCTNCPNGRCTDGSCSKPQTETLNGI